MVGAAQDDAIARLPQPIATTIHDYSKVLKTGRRLGGALGRIGEGPRDTETRSG